MMDELAALLASDGAEDVATEAWLLPLDVDNAGLLAGPALGADDWSSSDSPWSSTPSPRLEPVSSVEVSSTELKKTDTRSGSAGSSRSVGRLQVVAIGAKRRTRKQELTGLRDQVAKLTTELHALKLAAGIDLDTPVARAPQRLVAVPTSISCSSSLWRRLAERQRKLRLCSENDNKILRAAVNNHTRRTKRLCRSLRKHVDDDVR